MSFGTGVIRFGGLPLTTAIHRRRKVGAARRTQAHPLPDRTLCAPLARKPPAAKAGPRVYERSSAQRSGTLAKFAAMRRASGHVDTAIHTNGLTSDVGVLHERKHYAGNLGGGAEATYRNALRARL